MSQPQQDTKHGKTTSLHTTMLFLILFVMIAGNIGDLIMSRVSLAGAKTDMARSKLFTARFNALNTKMDLLDKKIDQRCGP